MAIIGISKPYTTVLKQSEWLAQKTAHFKEVKSVVDPYLAQRSRHEKQPVMDFLFEYYSFKPSNLKRWSPGFNCALEFDHFDNLPQITELLTDGNIAWIDPHAFAKRRFKSLNWILKTLINTQESRPSFACFGMHEWAMVYKSDQPRHSQIPLRFQPDKIAEIVESRPLLCTHFDAFRFFTPKAVPMNRYELSREKIIEMEQPGCIHSNMDLYKWAYKLFPWVPSELILDAFRLALEARTIDMQASPYDLKEYGLKPIKIETEEGRVEYKKAQYLIFEKGKPIRDTLISVYSGLIEHLKHWNNY